jgi:hypothetical protein
VDIAVASGYSALCLTLILLMNPVAPREAALDASAGTGLDSSVSNFLAQVGLPFLATATPQAVCASAAAASNSTVVLDVLVDGRGCPGVAAPSAPVASSSLPLDLPGRTLVIEACLARQ